MTRAVLGELLEGPFGTAQLVAVPDHPNAEVNIATWFMCLPDQGVGYDKFLLSVSLTRLPERPERVLRYPAAEYELVVLGLSPDQGPTADDPETWVPMEPENVVEQFHGISREQVAVLARGLAAGCTQGRLPGETQIYFTPFDGSEPRMMFVQQLTTIWKITVSRAVQHMRTGGLHDRVN